MKCRKVRALYTAFKDLELDKNLEKEVLKHIKRCDNCRTLYSTLDVVVSFAGKYEEVEPEGLVIDKILDRVKTQKQERKVPKPVFVITYAALFLFIVVISFGIMHRINVKNQLIAQKKQEELIKRKNRYIMDYGQFEKGRVIYTIPDNGYSAKVIETSY